MKRLRPTSSVNRNFIRVAVVVASMTLAGQSGLGTELHQGLVAYWPLDEGDGDVAVDAFGAEADNGELVNGPEWLAPANAILGPSALRFDGFDQEVLLRESLDLDIETNAVSLSAWVNLDLFPSELFEPFGGIVDSSQDNYILYLDRGNQELRFKVTDADGTAERPGIPESMLTLEEWNHVLGVYDGSEGVAKIYFNGEPVDMHSNSNLSNMVRAGQIAGIGSNPVPGESSVYFFPGAIDDVAVWNRPLGRAEATYLFNSGMGNAVGAANPDIEFVPDAPGVTPVPLSADPIIHYAFEGNLDNSGSGGPVLNGELLDTPLVNDTLFTTGPTGQALDLRENPVSSAFDGDAVSVDYELSDSGTIVFDYTVGEYYNFQSLWTNSIDPNDWEMWIYDDGRVRGRVDGDSFVTYDLDNLAGLDESYQIAFTWERGDDDNVEVKLYVDGELRDQDLSGTWVDPGGTVFIGGGDGTNHFGNGIWDEFQIFDVALSDGEILYLYSGLGLVGDFDNDGTIDVDDLDVLSQYAKDQNLAGDLNADGVVDVDDRVVWTETIQNSWLGDSNFDGEFSSGDFVTVFTAAKYETGQMAGYAEGDWNGDMVFDSGDFVAAFTTGGYELGRRPAAVAIPEPSGRLLLLNAIGLTLAWRRRRRNKRVVS